MAEQDISIVVRVQQLTTAAFQQVSNELKKLEVAADKAGTSASQGLGGGFDIAGGKLGNLTGMVTRFAGPAAIGYAIKQTVAWGDSIADLSDNSGIAVGTLLKLDAATTGTSASLGQVANAAQELSKRIGQGDTGAIAVIQKLGLNLNTLKTQDPGQTFIDLATAIEKIENPTERAAAKAAVFGKSYKDLGGAMKNLADGIDETSTASAASVVALGQMSDEVDKLWKQVKNLGAELVGGAIRIGQWGERWGEAFREIALGQKSVSGLTAPGSSLALPAGLVTPSGKALGLPEDMDSVLLDLKQQAETRKELNTATAKLAKAEDEIADFLQQELKSRWAALNRSIDDLRASVYGAAQIILRQANVLIPSSPLPGGGMTTLAGSVSGTSPGGLASSAWSQLQGSLGKVMPYVTGIAGLLSMFGGSGSTAGRIGGGIASGAGVGAMIGSIVPGLGTAIGAGAGALFGGIKSLFGSNKGQQEGKAADQSIGQLQQQLLATYGTLENIKRIGDMVGVSLAEAWGDKNVKGLAHFTELAKQFETQQDRLQTALDKYGLTWEDLGAKAKEFFLAAEAENLYKDYLLLNQAGIEQSVVLTKMAGAWNTLVQEAIRNGLTIPNAMKPAIDSLMQMGLLIDEAGNKITDLSQLFRDVPPITVPFNVEYNYPREEGPVEYGPSDPTAASVHVIKQEWNGRTIGQMVLEVGYQAATVNGVA